MRFHRRSACRSCRQHGFARAALVWLLAWSAIGGALVWRGNPGGGTTANTATALAGHPAMPLAAHPVRTKNIEDVQIGDWVMAKDPDQVGPPTPHQVIAVPQNRTAHVVHLSVAGGGKELEATRSHPFWTANRGWVYARDLAPTDQLQDEQGRAVSVLKTWEEDRRTATYNLTVEGVHTFYALAGTTPVLVHNTGGQEIFVTYTKTHPVTNVVYSGKSSGFGTPQQIVAARDVGHHMDQFGYGPATLDKWSTNEAAIRGREQDLIWRNGGATSEGGTSGNRINGIREDNPNMAKYLRESEKEFGLCR